MLILMRVNDSTTCPERRDHLFPSVPWFSGPPWLFTDTQVFSLTTGRALTSYYHFPHIYPLGQALKSCTSFTDKDCCFRRSQVKKHLQPQQPGWFIVTGVQRGIPARSFFWTEELWIDISFKPSCLTNDDPYGTLACYSPEIQTPGHFKGFIFDLLRQIM